MRIEKVIGFSAAVLAAFGAVAMPTKAEFQKVLPIVKEISAGDIAAVKAGKMNPVVAGDNALERAKDMSLDEASRYLFFESAFAHYVRAEEYDKAAGVIDALKSTIKDVPDSSVIELIERRLRKVPRKHAGQLYAMLQDARSRERLGKRLAVYKKAAAANPSDTIPQGRLAAAYVLLGDWEAAAKAFGKSGGEVARVMAAETSGGMAADKIADFWWTYKLLDTEFTDSADDLEEAFKAHAAVWYRKALQNGEIAGVKRKLIEKRIEGIQTPKAQETVKPPQIKPGVRDAHRTMTLDVGNGCKLEFVECPAGTFKLGAKWAEKPTEANFLREVTITRPYWIAKYPLTFGDYEAIMGKPLPALSQEEQAIVRAIGPKMPVAFNCLGDGSQRLAYEVIERIRKTTEPSLPKGQVVRLPTCAEFYGAITEHGRSCYLGRLPFDFYSLEDVKKLLVRKNVSLSPRLKLDSSKDGHVGFGNIQIFGPVGERKPTAWGICDLAGNTLLLDRGPFEGAHFLTPVHTAREKDPLIAGDGRLVSAQTRWVTYIMSYGSQIRLVIGPDLIKEKGLEDKYKDMLQVE